MSRDQGLLEVIALDARDAEQAQLGGADRVELVTDMALDGLTPSDAVVREVLAATDLPVRVMLRESGSFLAANLDALRARANELLALGAKEFVLGFLTEEGRVDELATRALVRDLQGASWTFHRAVDNARDVRGAYARAARLGCDTILTAGHADGVTEGARVLEQLASHEEPPMLMAGGGLRADHVARLREAGVRAFHVGSGVRPLGWVEPVDADAVRRWSELVHG
ncbi:copper homeostasis protein CutC [Amycolatopsis magusensis]|uniref:Copper homeostasis protein cutC homolog n=1 Tax=Amycolatopsis magusensis TaxID=882444 RepID=A0ABS4PI35_9PSEU|nr:copper homeostasis protein CutC [Amycolatopsis magusensis]MBP2179073.1 copper homeostasis protein [Amycolatopsis magusensis]